MCLRCSSWWLAPRDIFGCTRNWHNNTHVSRGAIHFAELHRRRQGNIYIYIYVTIWIQQEIMKSITFYVNITLVNSEHSTSYNILLLLYSRNNNNMRSVTYLDMWPCCFVCVMSVRCINGEQVCLRISHLYRWQYDNEKTETMMMTMFLVFRWRSHFRFTNTTLFSSESRIYFFTTLTRILLYYYIYSMSICTFRVDS